MKASSANAVPHEVYRKAPSAGHYRPAPGAQSRLSWGARARNHAKCRAPSPRLRAQAWLKYAQTKTARHKLAKFLREHAHLLPVPPASPAPPAQPPRAPERSSSGKGPGEAAGEAELPGGQVTWLVVQCSDRPGLLADIALAIADHGHNIKARPAQDSNGWDCAHALLAAAACRVHRAGAQEAHVCNAFNYL